MRYKVTVVVDTDIPQAQLPELFSNVGYPAIKTRQATVEVVRVKPSIADLIAQQEQWIKEHGGDEDGYKNNYGMDRPEYAAAIYAADVAELMRLKAL